LGSVALNVFPGLIPAAVIWSWAAAGEFRPDRVLAEAFTAA
jgi:hypothetical protein